MLTSVRLRLFALGTLYSAPYVAMLAWCWHSYQPRSVAVLLLSAVLISLLVGACTRTWRSFFLACFPLLILAIGYVAYATGFGIVPGDTLGMVLVSASAEEVFGLLTVWHQKWVLLPLLAMLAVYLWLTWTLPALPIFSRKTFIVTRVMLGLAIPVTVYAAQNGLQLVDGLTLNPVAGSVIFLAGQLPRAYREIHGGNVHKAPLYATRAATDEEVHVLVIGESARRGSWSLYGYERETTPYLDKIKPELVLLQHAVADANLTYFAVPMILTGYGPEEFRSAKPLGNILDLAKEAHYTTAWLVNQDIGVSTASGVTADTLVFPPDTRTTLFGRRVPDSALLPAYQRELARSGRSRFIGLHVMGSHWEYFERYPPKFQRWGDAHNMNMRSIFALDPASETAVRDAYDNSVLYTDWFLEQIIEGARQLHVPATVTFIPDHGESLNLLGDGTDGHGGPDFHASQFAIPAFVWVNAAYRSAHPDKVAALNANAAKEIRSHDFFYTEADLLGVTWPGARPERSFASTAFAPDMTSRHLLAGILKPIPEPPETNSPSQR
jgi:glucan phosphoethanolaminetransferase (alkaline phosphatase superfamily)